jgi:hypothetical protein
MPNLVLDPLLKKLQACLESDVAEPFLTVLLDAMAVAMLVDAKCRASIHGFEGRYVFKTPDKKVGATAVFGGNHMSVSHQAIDRPEPNVTVTFRNPKALMELLLSRTPDLIGAMLKQDVNVDGNLNYLYRFAFLARHLQLMATRCA